MGMTIDEHIAQLKTLKSFHNGSYGASINFAIDTMHKYQMMQADYENRLKADLKAILVELQLEIEEKEQYYQDEFLKSKNAIRDAAMGGRMFVVAIAKKLSTRK